MPKGIITNMIKAYIRINDLNDIKTLHEAAFKLQIRSGGAVREQKYSIQNHLWVFSVLAQKKTVSLVAKYDDKRDFLEKFGDLIST